MSTTQPSGTAFPDQLKHIQENMRALSRGQPKTMEAFASLHRDTAEEGVLDMRTKEIIALAIAVFARCDGCIAFHTHDALRAGATKDEILDALGVAILMGGGPSMIYATHVVEAIEQFQAADWESAPLPSPQRLESDRSTQRFASTVSAGSSTE